MDQITREIYLKSSGFKETIEMTQGTDAISIVFTLGDFEIPETATAVVYVTKPSGKQVMEACTVDAANNQIIINMTTQMTAEAGESSIQVQISDRESTVFTFNYPLEIEESTAAIDSETGSSLIDKYLSDITTATQESIDATTDLKRKLVAGELSASVTIGTTTTGESGASAAVENVGDKQNVLNDTPFLPYHSSITSCTSRPCHTTYRISKFPFLPYHSRPYLFLPQS
jgi:hypothetical protein